MSKLFIGLLLVAVLFNIIAAKFSYKVSIAKRSQYPVLSYVNKTSTYQQIFNPSWIEASAGTKGVKGIIARTQNCPSNVGDACAFCGGSEAKASILTFSPEVSPNVFKPVDETSVIFGPGDSTDTWGTEDPRVQYNAADGLYYMFYTAYNGKDIQLSLATSANPTDPAAWTKRGPLFPQAQNTKSAALLLRKEGPHYLFWGDHDIRVVKSTDPAAWPDQGSVFISPRADNFDSQLVESGPPPLLLSTGDYLFFYNSAELGWPSNTATSYNVGYVILDGQDPTNILARSSAPLLSPEFSWEEGVAPYPCNVPNVVFLEAAHPVEGMKDTFRVFFGAADANIGSAIVTVGVSDAL